MAQNFTFGGLRYFGQLFYMIGQVFGNTALQCWAAAEEAIGSILGQEEEVKLSSPTNDQPEPRARLIHPTSRHLN